jgi:hypothetical protein
MWEFVKVTNKPGQNYKQRRGMDTRKFEILWKIRWYELVIFSNWQNTLDFNEKIFNNLFLSFFIQISAHFSFISLLKKKYYGRVCLDIRALHIRTGVGSVNLHTLIFEQGYTYLNTNWILKLHFSFSVVVMKDSKKHLSNKNWLQKHPTHLCCTKT